MIVSSDPLDTRPSPLDTDTRHLPLLPLTPFAHKTTDHRLVKKISEARRASSLLLCALGVSMVNPLSISPLVTFHLPLITLSLGAFGEQYDLHRLKEDL
jgi:hypothetical protein